ncbi:MAG: DUF4240 domain-containing protein [Fimbriimonadaceae bacterium]
MTLDQFWQVIDRINAPAAKPRFSQPFSKPPANGGMDEKLGKLEAELAKLPTAEKQSFADHFDECDARAYSWELWGAAYVIHGGCSDDSFMDFRSTLICMGRAIFEAALADPESLANLEIDEDDLFYEGFGYTAHGNYDQISRNVPFPEKPRGQEWDEEQVGDVYPQLAKKFGW